MDRQSNFVKSFTKLSLDKRGPNFPLIAPKFSICSSISSKKESCLLWKNHARPVCVKSYLLLFYRSFKVIGKRSTIYA